MFSCDKYEIFKNTYSQNTYERLPLKSYDAHI